MQDAKNYQLECVHAVRLKCRTQRSPKIPLLCTITPICRAISSQLRHVSTIGKKPAKHQYVLHMSSQYGELRPTSNSDRLAGLGHPYIFQRVSRCYCSDGAQQKPTNLCTMFGRLLGCYTTPCLKKRPLWLAIIFTWFDYDNFWHKCYRESRQPNCSLFSNIT